MKIRQRFGGPVLAAVVAIALTACVGEEDAPEAMPTTSAMATPTPVFASEEEVLAAAVETYEGFLAQSDQIMIEGGVDPHRIERFLTAELAASELEGYAELSSRGLIAKGRTLVTNAALQSYDALSARGQAVVRIYACVDVSEVQVFTQEGVALDLSHRPDDATFEVAFDQNVESDPVLVVSEKLLWGGESIC